MGIIIVYRFETRTISIKIMQKIVTSLSFKWFALPTLAVSSAFLLGLPTNSVANLSSEPVTQSMPLPPPNTLLAAPQPSVLAQTDEQANAPKIVKIQKNDSLSTALDRIGVTKQVIHQIATSKNSKLITFIKPGDTLEVWFDEQGELQKIHYPKTALTSVEVVKTDLGFDIDQQVKNVEIRTKTAFGEIKGAFYPAAERAGLSPKSIMELADMLAWDVDFARELRDGDTFKVIYETRYLNGEYIGDGDILAAQVTTDNGAQVHNGFILRNAKNDVIGFYDEKGNNLKKAFLKAPMDTVRITSRFNPKRVHPIFGNKRPHRGVDYGAATGTPIRVTGNGQITYLGWNGGYGKSIKVRHTNGYETYYAHMSKYGKYKKGQIVKQGDIIGYVGNTGNSTGPHLHYEFRINGEHVDPLKMKFPAAGPVAKEHKTEFMQRSNFLLSQLERIGPHEQFAANFE